MYAFSREDYVLKKYLEKEKFSAPTYVEFDFFVLNLRLLGTPWVDIICLSCLGLQDKCLKMASKEGEVAGTKH